ncbi:MAG TPA: hypothetical protein VG013_09885 [Gemmataceae bacterium]|jgi:hypothetical protein|nr:hypothetical protein [Gemmataceae bacterium]
MKHLPVQLWWLILPVYLVGGLVLGLADPHLGRWVQGFGVRPGLATAASVNLLLPLLVIGLGVACPRLGTAWLGATGITVAFILGLALVYPPARPWGPATLLGAVPPVLVMACVGYAILGTLTVLLARAAWK